VLSLLDNLLRQILMDGVMGLKAAPQSPVTEDQVGFRPPDEQWVKDVKNLQLNALNVYLVDLRENRKLRSNEQVRSIENGVVYEDPAPTRLDCHYLISGWSPTEQLPPRLSLCSTSTPCSTRRRRSCSAMRLSTPRVCIQRGRRRSTPGWSASAR
jgi:hypothetical protein